MKGNLTIAFLSSIALLLTQCKEDDEKPAEVKEYTKTTLTYKTVAGADANLLSLDLYHF